MAALKIPTTLTSELLADYDVSNETLISKEKDFETEVGDIKQPDFYPQVKVKRWENECNFSCRLIDTELGTPAVSYDKEKVVWSKGNLEAHFHNIGGFTEREASADEGVFKFDIILKSKPASNELQFSIQHKGLDFFYQPLELDAQEIADGCFRPPEACGSYAVYHKTMSGDFTKMGGKNYKAGQAFYLFRPKVSDADGKEEWGALNIDEAGGILTVTIPQSFLDTATYPVTVDPDFGYTTAGGASQSHENFIHFVDGVVGATGGTVDSITMSLSVTTAAKNSKGGLWVHTSITDAGALVGGVETDAVNVPVQSQAWVQHDYSTKPSVSASTSYHIGGVGESGSGGFGFFYNVIGPTRAAFLAHTYSDFLPDPATGEGTNTRRASIYASYTESGAGLSIPVAMHHYTKNITPRC